MIQARLKHVSNYKIQLVRAHPLSLTCFQTSTVFHNLSAEDSNLQLSCSDLL